MAHFIQIDDVVREATAEEIVVIEKKETEYAQAEADRKAKEQTRAAALAKLELSADEITALFG